MLCDIYHKMFHCSRKSILTMRLDHSRYPIEHLVIVTYSYSSNTSTTTITRQRHKILNIKNYSVAYTSHESHACHLNSANDADSGTVGYCDSITTRLFNVDFPNQIHYFSITYLTGWTMFYT